LHAGSFVQRPEIGMADDTADPTANEVVCELGFAGIVRNRVEFGVLRVYSVVGVVHWHTQRSLQNNQGLSEH
jgi:hypothetical protein